jgi:hypothetical protein
MQDKLSEAERDLRKAIDDRAGLQKDNAALKEKLYEYRLKEKLGTVDALSDDQKAGVLELSFQP